jgi:hypothetical protein
LTAENEHGIPGTAVNFSTAQRAMTPSTAAALIFELRLRPFQKAATAAAAALSHFPTICDFSRIQ